MNKDKLESFLMNHFHYGDEFHDYRDFDNPDRDDFVSHYWYFDFEPEDCVDKNTYFKWEKANGKFIDYPAKYLNPKQCHPQFDAMVIGEAILGDDWNDEDDFWETSFFDKVAIIENFIVERIYCG